MQPSSRKFEGTPEDLTYPRMEPRRVKSTGHIHYGKESIFISSALSGWSVGLESCGKGKFNVHFGRLLLGQYDETTASFKRSDASTSKPKGVGVNLSPQTPLRRPQNGTQAHDLSRELEFGRPAQVGATPFWDRRRAPSGRGNQRTKV